MPCVWFDSGYSRDNSLSNADSHAVFGIICYQLWFGIMESTKSMAECTDIILAPTLLGILAREFA